METGATRGLRGFKKTHHGIPVLEHFNFRPRRDEFERVALGMTQNKSSARRKQSGQFRVIEQTLGK